MSTSNIPQKHQLRIKVDHEYEYLVKVSLFDSDNRIIKPLDTKYDYLFDLQKGLYTVRVEMNAEVNDQVITVDADMEYLVSNNFSGNTENIIEPPQQYSSALLSGDYSKAYGSSHEYYTYPAIDISKNDTFHHDSNNIGHLDSSLFIFMRFPSLEKYNELRDSWPKSFYHDFEIVNEYGEQVIHFGSGTGILVNENDGWVAFNASLQDGTYYLIYNGSEPRQIPIYVFKNWHTQFFMTLGNEPLYGSIRIFISRQREFDPKEKTNKYIDVLLDKLQNADYSVDENLIRLAANDKYQSPMLGLICSYVYFMSPQKDNDELFSIITNNMHHIILKSNDDSPDLRALTILAANHLGKSNYKKTAVKGTPMLRIGFEAVKMASIKNRSMIGKNSINDFISETLFYDSPFTTFKPVTVYKKRPQVIDRLENAENILTGEEREKFSIDKSRASHPGSTRKEPAVDKYKINISDHYTSDLIDFIKTNDTNTEFVTNWVKVSISDLLNTDDNISINDIAGKLNLSGNTITRVFDELKQELKSKK